MAVNSQKQFAAKWRRHDPEATDNEINALYRGVINDPKRCPGCGGKIIEEPGFNPALNVPVCGAARLGCTGVAGAPFVEES